MFHLFICIISRLQKSRWQVDGNRYSKTNSLLPFSGCLKHISLDVVALNCNHPSCLTFLVSINPIYLVERKINLVKRNMGCVFSLVPFPQPHHLTVKFISLSKLNWHFSWCTFKQILKYSGFLWIFVIQNVFIVLSVLKLPLLLLNAVVHDFVF